MSMREPAVLCECGRCADELPTRDWDEYAEYSGRGLTIIKNHHRLPAGFEVIEKRDGYYWAGPRGQKKTVADFKPVCQCRSDGAARRSCGDSLPTTSRDEYTKMRAKGYLIIKDGHHARGGVTMETREGYHYEVTAGSLALP